MYVSFYIIDPLRRPIGLWFYKIHVFGRESYFKQRLHFISLENEMICFKPACITQLHVATLVNEDDTNEMKD